MATMKAVRIHEYGGPDVLKYEDAPKPVPAAGEVLIRVHAAGVNPVDWKVRAGYAKERLKYQMPFIPGWDVSGVIEAVGSSAKRLKVGDPVYSRPDISRDGSYAEYDCSARIGSSAEAQVDRPRDRGGDSACVADGLAGAV